jgi:hypothetical protein
LEVLLQLKMTEADVSVHSSHHIPPEILNCILGGSFSIACCSLSPELQAPIDKARAVGEALATTEPRAVKAWDAATCLPDEIFNQKIAKIIEALI